MSRKHCVLQSPFNLINILFLFILSLIFLYPFWYVVVCSITDPSLLRGSTGFVFLPKGITLAGYQVCFRNPNIWSGYYNTLIYVVSGTFISMVLTTLGGYALSRPGLMLKKPIMILITITMFFSGGLVPTYMLVQNLGMINTRWAIIIPGALSTYNMIVMRTSFQGIPSELLESASCGALSSPHPKRCWLLSPCFMPSGCGTAGSPPPFTYKTATCFLCKLFCRKFLSRTAPSGPALLAQKYCRA